MAGVGLLINTLSPVPTRRLVHARLIAPVGWYTLPDGSPREAVTHWTATVADDGTWSVDLPPNSSFDAVDTWYRIDEPGYSHAATIPAGPGPFQLRDVAIIDPAGSACCPPPPAGSVTPGARTLEELLDVEGTATAVPGDLLVRSAAGPWRPSAPVESPRGVRHQQSVPVALVQIVHGLSFRPAGVLCTDLLDQLTEPDRITSPLPGITEITFGAPFAGVVDLS